MATNDIVRKPSTAFSIPFTVPSGGKTQGEIYLVQDTYTLVWNAESTYGTKDFTAGDLATGIVRCAEAKLPKVGGSGGPAVVVGDNLYLSKVDLNVSPTKAGNYTFYIGTATQAATGTSTYVYADFDFRRASS